MFLRVLKLIILINHYFSTEVKLDLKDYKYEQNSVLDLKELYRVVMILREIIMINFLFTLYEGFTHAKLHLSLKHPCKEDKTGAIFLTLRRR